MNYPLIPVSAHSTTPADASRRLTLRKAGHVLIGTSLLPAVSLLASPSAKAGVWVLPTLAFIAGYGFSRLWAALHRSNERFAQERLRDRMGGFDFPRRDNVGSLGLFLGQPGTNIDVTSRVHWPEWGYHDAKVAEGGRFSYPASPSEGVSFSDKQIFEEAVKGRMPSRIRGGEAYARDYRDAQGNDLRIVAARLPDGQTVVAESDGRTVTGYNVNAVRG